MTGSTARLWDVGLIEGQGPGTLVRVAKEGRLVRVSASGAARLDLHWVDETALALLEAAIARGRSITFLYPALAPEVAVLLAAEYLIHALVNKKPEPSVGLVTADPARAARVWEELRVESQGSRVPLWEVFPYWRASPEGDAPFNGLLRGVVIGRRCANWGVDLTIVDELAGPVEVMTTGAVVRVAADPLEYDLDRLVDEQHTIWGWSEATLRAYTPPPRPQPNIPRAPFSMAADRVAVLTLGVTTTVRTCAHDDAASAIADARTALVLLSERAGHGPSRHVLTGLRVAWAHLSTLSSLPCRPSEYDRYAGVPPRAARATVEFDREVAGWARTLEEPLREPAEAVASALGRLRAALESGNPLRAAIERASLEPSQGHLVVRTRTAARAVCAAFHASELDLRIGSLQVTWFANLHKVPIRPRAVIVGAPPRSGWHRLGSGIAGSLDVLVVGAQEAKRAVFAWDALRVSRAYWSSQRFRTVAWKQLISTTPPPAYAEVDVPAAAVALLSGPQFTPAVDPFSPLGALLFDDRPLLAEEGISEQLVERVSEHEYRSSVAAVEVYTDKGYVLIPGDHDVDVISGDQLTSEIATKLTRGMRIVLGREGGRIDLLAAIEDRLGGRDDLIAAKALVDEYQQRVRRSFRTKFLDDGLDATDFCDRMKRNGCKKSDTAIKGWVLRGGPMGPRDLEDIRLISTGLGLAYGDLRLQAIDSGLRRIRTFRQQAGLAVSRAATAALLTREDSRIDAELGLSVADLREAVIVATVITLRTFPRRVHVTEIGHLEEVPFT
jgi:hypothetical protein